MSDWTQEEKKMLNGLGEVPKMTPKNVFKADANLLTLNTTVNWVTNGAVTPVMDQGNCSAGWAFSATSALAAAQWLFKKD